MIRGEAVVLDETIGWLDAVAAEADDDIVVSDRLDRAARAEFVDGDQEAAQRAFDELLAAGLPTASRLQVLAAAAWQARRHGAHDRSQRFVTELSAKIAELRPEELGREVIANAVASTLRLLPADERPDWVGPVTRYLPLELPLPEWVDSTARTAAADRREVIRRAREVWRRDGMRAETGLVAGDGGQLLWWLPRAEGGRDVVWVTVAEWLDAVRRVAATDALPEWPWLVEPVAGESPMDTFAGVPLVRGVRPSNASVVEQRRWLLPVLTLALLVAFGFAVGQQLRAQRREAAAVAAQAEFLTTVTHELKTPLASIRLLGEMLVEGRAEGREAQYYRMLASESGRLTMLIENVLDLGRVERGERAYDLRPCDIGEIVHETAALVEPLANREDAEIRVHDDGGGPFQGRTDRAALVQALISVLDNARKYGKGPIDVVVARDNDAITVSVRDHGPGVPAGERDRIFGRFTRGESHAHGSTPGVGIGLYLARVIARRLGGDLVCAAEGNGDPGARFVFRLPTTDSDNR